MNDQHFTDLALKAIVGRASAEERAELAQLLAAHPELEKELEELRADADLAKKVLPLLGEEKVQAGELPGYARVRLQGVVKRSQGNPANAQTNSRPELIRPKRWWHTFVPVGAVAPQSWLGVVAVTAVVLIVVFFTFPQLTGKNGSQVAAKPVIQLAMLDSVGQTRGAEEKATEQLLATLKKGLQQTNLASFTEAKDLKQWSSEWPSDKNATVIKVCYDRDLGSIRVLAQSNGKQLIERKFPVTKEQDLTAVLKDQVVPFIQQFSPP